LRRTEGLTRPKHVNTLNSVKEMLLGVKERKARQKKFLRQEILDAASELFVKEGYENVSMRRVADKIEYSPTTIYLYFKDKAELLEQVCRETFARLRQVLMGIEKLSGDPVERLKRGLVAYVKFGLENPHHYRATFMMPIPEGFDEEKYANRESPGMQAFDFLRRRVYDCIAAGRFRKVDPELVSQTLWAGIHGVTSLLIIHRKSFRWVGTDQLIHSMVDTLIRGASSEEA
jgi:AcrR family transcriptional regulator